jgi:gluconokinase
VNIGESAPVRAHPIVVVMGVAASGKSSIGRALAAQCGFDFVEGDDLHPQANIERMSRGLSLGDSDRRDWLENIADVIEGADPSRGLILSCSALKRSYRDRLTAASPRVTFLHLSGQRALIEARMSRRAGHFMPITLLDSQYGDLEPPAADESAVTVDVAGDFDEVVELAARRLGLRCTPEAAG